MRKLSRALNILLLLIFLVSITLVSGCGWYCRKHKECDYNETKCTEEQKKSCEEHKKCCEEKKESGECPHSKEK